MSYKQQLRRLFNRMNKREDPVTEIEEFVPVEWFNPGRTQ